MQIQRCRLQIQGRHNRAISYQKLDTGKVRIINSLSVCLHIHVYVHKYMHVCVSMPFAFPYAPGPLFRNTGNINVQEISLLLVKKNKSSRRSFTTGELFAQKRKSEFIPSNSVFK